MLVVAPRCAFTLSHKNTRERCNYRRTVAGKCAVLIACIVAGNMIISGKGGSGLLARVILTLRHHIRGGNFCFGLSHFFSLFGGSSFLSKLSNIL